MNEAIAAERVAQAEKPKKAVEKEKDFMSRTGKDRNPRASESDNSSFR